jgi:hypothetical protein
LWYGGLRVCTLKASATSPDVDNSGLCIEAPGDTIWSSAGKAWSMVAFPDRNLMELWFDCVRCHFGTFMKNRLHEDRVRVQKRHDEQCHLRQFSGEPDICKTKVDFRFAGRNSQRPTYLQMSLLPASHDGIEDGLFPEHRSTGGETQALSFCLTHRHH